MIEIEDNIPIPPLSQPFRSVFTDAMEDMKVGQSFVFDSKDRSKVRGVASRLKKAGRTYSQRKIGYGNQYRIWRTK